MSHEDGQQGRTLVVLLTLLINLVPGGLTRTVIIGQGRKIIADLGERPVPQLAPRPRIGEKGFLPSHQSIACPSGKLGRADGRPRKASRVVPSYSETPFRRQEEVRPRPKTIFFSSQVEYWTPHPPANGHAKPELPQPNLRPHHWPYR